MKLGTVVVMLAMAYGALQVAAASPPAPDCRELSRKQCRAALAAWAEELNREAAELSAARALPKGWEAGCVQDRVTLEWTCFTTKFFDGPVGRTPRIRVDHFPTLGYCFSSVLNDYPGRQALVRIGDNEPIRYSGLACGEKGQQIIRQLLSEQPGAARGYTWPSGIEEFDFSAEGFPTAFEALQERVANPRP